MLVVLTSGPESILVCGAVMSAGATTVQVCTAGVASVLPAAVGRPHRELMPTDHQTAHLERRHGKLTYAAPSSAHSNVATSSAENINDALGLVVLPSGPESILVCGAVTSAGSTTVQVCTAGVASVLPAVSVARTANSCPPTTRPAHLEG